MDAFQRLFQLRHPAKFFQRRGVIHLQKIAFFERGDMIDGDVHAFDVAENTPPCSCRAAANSFISEAAA